MFRKRGVRIAVGVLVGAPTAALTGLGCYALFRHKTKPPEHVFKPLVKEDGSLIMNDGVIKPPTRFQVILRIIRLLWIFIPVICLYYVMRYKHFAQWSEMVLRAVEKAGPAFTKLGQWAVTRSDLFPEELRNTLEKLYSEVSVHPFKDSKRIIEQELGKPMSEVFEDVGEATLGSGSIGQVHKAKLKETGEHVIIKVMHPNVVTDISKDFVILNGIARWVHKNVPSMEYVDIQTICLDFTTHLAAQLDFRIELEHLELFNEHFKDVDYVIFPKPFFATQQILVEGYVPGVPATPKYLSSLPSHTRHILAGKGLDCFCKMMLRDNFLHGDMHPGNILIDASNPDKPQSYMIDVGLCQKLTNEEGAVMNDFVAGFTYWEAPLSSNALLKMGDQKYIPSIDNFQKDFAELFEHFRPATEDTEQVVSNILQSVFDVCRDHKIRLYPQYMSQMWGTLILEGFINALDPNFNMVRHATPWLVSDGGMMSLALVKNVIVSSTDSVVERFFKSKLSAVLPSNTPTEKELEDKKTGIKRSTVELGHTQAQAA